MIGFDVKTKVQATIIDVFIKDLDEYILKISSLVYSLYTQADAIKYSCNGLKNASFDMILSKIQNSLNILYIERNVQTIIDSIPDNSYKDIIKSTHTKITALIAVRLSYLKIL